MMRARRPARRSMDPDSRRGPAAEAGPEIIVDDPRWRRLVPRAERVARRAALTAGGAGTVLLASDQAVRRLNARHRGRNKPTNVLTFESGDIVLALGVVRREARAQRRLPAHHLAHLVVHGALHLQGHDHHHPGEARRMEMAEARLLRRIGVPNPWRSRMSMQPLHRGGVWSLVRTWLGRRGAEHNVRDSIAELVQQSADAGAEGGRGAGARPAGARPARQRAALARPHAPTT